MQSLKLEKICSASKVRGLLTLPLAGRGYADSASFVVAAMLRCEL